MPTYTPRPLQVKKEGEWQAPHYIWKTLNSRVKKFYNRLKVTQFNIGDCVTVKFYPKPIKDLLLKDGIKVSWAVTKDMRTYMMWRIA